MEKKMAYKVRSAAAAKPGRAGFRPVSPGPDLAKEPC
jgi:hypothetical protein